MKLRVCEEEVDRFEALERSLAKSVAEREAIAGGVPDVAKSVGAVRLPPLPVDDVLDALLQRGRKADSDRRSAARQYTLGVFVRSTLRLRNAVRDFFRWGKGP